MSNIEARSLYTDVLTGTPPDPHPAHKVWMAAVDRPVAAIQYSPHDSPAGYCLRSYIDARDTSTHTRSTPTDLHGGASACDASQRTVPMPDQRIGPPIACISVHRPLFTDFRPSEHLHVPVRRVCAHVSLLVVCAIRPSSDRAQTELRPSSDRTHA
jgi:hypothetical protein